MAKMEPVKVFLGTDGTMAASMEIDGKFVPLGIVSFDEAWETASDGGTKWPGSLDVISGMTKSFTISMHDTSPQLLAILTGQPQPLPEVPYVSVEGLVKKPTVIIPPKAASPVGYGDLQKAINDLYKKMNPVIVNIAAQMQEFGGKVTQAAESINAIAADSPPSDNADRATKLRRMIPGIDDEVTLPCAHWRTGRDTVWYAIQHLNDTHNPENGHKDPWSRERIADWLETLDADLRVADAPVLREGDWVRGRISQALGMVVEGLEGDEVVVRWERSGLRQVVRNRELVLTKAPIVPKMKPVSQLILVDAYKPPSDDPIIHWGSKKITKNIY